MISSAARGVEGFLSRPCWRGMIFLHGAGGVKGLLPRRRWRGRTPSAARASGKDSFHGRGGVEGILPRPRVAWKDGPGWLLPLPRPPWKDSFHATRAAVEGVLPPRHAGPWKESFPAARSTPPVPWKESFAYMAWKDSFRGAGGVQGLLPRAGCRETNSFHASSLIIMH